MARFSDKIRREKADIPRFKMRIGIHTGPVVVGTLGNKLRVEFKAVGDTVNLASRMEAICEPITIPSGTIHFRFSPASLHKRERCGKGRKMFPLCQSDPSHVRDYSRMFAEAGP